MDISAIKVIKRNGEEVEFDITKIIRAIEAANRAVDRVFRLNDYQIRSIADNVVARVKERAESVSVEDIQDMVEIGIMAMRGYEVAQKYVRYRYKRELARIYNAAEDGVQALLAVITAETGLKMQEGEEVKGKELYNTWLTEPYFDEATKAELQAIAGDEKEIEDRFYKDLEFGTAGLRGRLGAGTNRMNIYTVRRATQGLANYIKGCIGDGGIATPQAGCNASVPNASPQAGCNVSVPSAPAVAIAYDSRHMSPEFADEAALTLAANGITAHVFPSLRPTPELSFAVRHLGCIAGINITASHNPPDYNGYKVYWSDGAQITPPHDTGIMDEVKAVTDWAAVRTMKKEEAEAAGLYRIIGAETDDAYIAELKKQILHPEAIAACGADLKVVYSPLHGTGNVPARRVLAELGFQQVTVVPEQEKPDGDFPTVSYPNPEADEAFTLGLALAKQIDADLVLATDPDADRLGVRVKDAAGEYHTLTGNMSGCLLADYEIGQRKAVQGLPDDGALVTTIVSSGMAGAIAKYYGVELIETLTGFKYIGQKILEFEDSGRGTYLFGFEESYGCLIGTHARDKDAIVATMALCEAAAYYRTQGKTLWDAMLDLYERVGYFRDGVTSVTHEGAEGQEKIRAIMAGLRANTPETIGDHRVLAVRDYAADTRRDLATGEVTPAGLPKSDVLYYELSDDAWIAVRPSGTEPKIKFYFGVRGTSIEDMERRAASLDAALLELAGKAGG